MRSVRRAAPPGGARPSRPPACGPPHRRPATPTATSAPPKRACTTHGAGAPLVCPRLFAVAFHAAPHLRSACQPAPRQFCMNWTLPIHRRACPPPCWPPKFSPQFNPSPCLPPRAVGQLPLEAPVAYLRACPPAGRPIFPQRISVSPVCLLPARPAIWASAALLPSTPQAGNFPLSRRPPPPCLLVHSPLRRPSTLLVSRSPSD